MAKSNRTSDKNRWISENLDRINLTVPKGRKEIIQNHAQTHGESSNGFINRAISETMARDQEKDSREQRIVRIAAESGKSTEDVVDEELEEAALAILQRKVPRIRELYLSEKQRRLPSNKPILTVGNLGPRN